MDTAKLWVIVTVSAVLLSCSTVNRIERDPEPLKWERTAPANLSEFPKYDPTSRDPFQMDLRGLDLRQLNLTDRLSDLVFSTFDSQTRWSALLPHSFDPNTIMEVSKNPGLGVRALHREGITGRGVGIAIIDQALLVNHVEYRDRLKRYEEINWPQDWGAQMHGPAVASIAVGKTIGVAPESDLYFIATNHMEVVGGKKEPNIAWYGKAIERIIEINRTLPATRKIRVISISFGMIKDRIGGRHMGHDAAMAAINRAETEGIHVIFVDSRPFDGLNRAPLDDPDDISSYQIGSFWNPKTYFNRKNLLVPMDSRTLASPTGERDCVFYRHGGMSWVVPYLAGLYALACQVRPDVTPDTFWKTILETGDFRDAVKGRGRQLGPIVNPRRLIERLRNGSAGQVRP